jgi:hypothetical protein
MKVNVAAGIDFSLEVDDAVLARVLNCNRATVQRYARAGVIDRLKNRKYALYPSIAKVLDHLRVMSGRQPQGEAMAVGAALKDAQRRLTEMKLAKLDGGLMSLPEAEALWGDFMLATKWLFLSIPKRARMELGISAEVEGRMSELCATMLREVAFSGQMQLPTAERADDDDDSDGSENSADSERQPAGKD